MPALLNMGWRRRQRFAARRKARQRDQTNRSNAVQARTKQELKSVRLAGLKPFED
jgi:hypothetical protein